MRLYEQDRLPDARPEWDGDGAFYGVDMMTAPNLVAAGHVCVGENKQFDLGRCGTRKGCLPVYWASVANVTFDEEGVPTANEAIEGEEQWGVWLRKLPLWGACAFSDPNGVELLCLASSKGLIVAREGFIAVLIPWPDGVVLEAPVQVVQCYEKVLIVRGDGLEPWVWGGDTGASAVERYSVHVPSPDPDPLPYGKWLTYFKDRPLMLFGKDGLAVGQVARLDYDAALLSELLNFGTDDALQCIYAFGQDALAIPATQSIWLVTDFYGDYTPSGLPANIRVQLVTREKGTLAPKSVAGWGTFMAFLASDGVWMLQQVLDNGNVGGAALAEKPLSYPIEPLIQRMNWNLAHLATATTWNGRYYLAVPLNDAETGEVATGNNAILIYHITRGVWEGVWTSEDWDIRDFVKTDYMGQRRLMLVHSAGCVLVLEAGTSDIIFDEEYEIADRVVTRGYNPGDPERYRAQHLRLNMATWRPKYSIKSKADGVAEERQWVTDKVRDATLNRQLERRRWTEDNRNNDHGAPGRDDYALSMERGGYGVFTADADTDVLTSEGHGLSNGMEVFVNTFGTLPAPLVAGTRYFVRDVTTDTFKVAATSGGAALDITSAGTGTHRWTRLGVILHAGGVRLGLAQEFEEVVTLHGSWYREGRSVQVELRNTQGRLELTGARVAGKAGRTDKRLKI